MSSKPDGAREAALDVLALVLVLVATGAAGSPPKASEAYIAEAEPAESFSGPKDERKNE
jgi:hypothetical protein